MSPQRSEVSLPISSGVLAPPLHLGKTVAVRLRPLPAPEAPPPPWVALGRNHLLTSLRSGTRAKVTGRDLTCRLLVALCDIIADIIGRPAELAALHLVCVAGLHHDGGQPPAELRSALSRVRKHLRESRPIRTQEEQEVNSGAESP